MDILIVEDEELYADQLQLLIRRIGHHPCAVAESAEEALKKFEMHQIDLAIIDINLKGEMDGLELGKWLRRLSQLPVIFITSHYDNDEYFEKASLLSAFGFIRKPLDETQLFRTITLALNYQSASHTNPIFATESLPPQPPLKAALLIQSKSKLVKIKQEDILFIEADDKHCTIHLDDGQQYLERISLKEISKKLLPQIFAQSQRSFIVNLDKIQEINTSEFTIKIQDFWIPLGNSYKEYFLKKFGFQ